MLRESSDLLKSMVGAVSVDAMVVAASDRIVYAFVMKSTENGLDLEKGKEKGRGGGSVEDPSPQKGYHNRWSVGMSGSRQRNDIHLTRPCDQKEREVFAVRKEGLVCLTVIPTLDIAWSLGRWCGCLGKVSRRNNPAYM